MMIMHFLEFLLILRAKINIYTPCISFKAQKWYNVGSRFGLMSFKE